MLPLVWGSLENDREGLLVDIDAHDSFMGWVINGSREPIRMSKRSGQEFAIEPRAGMGSVSGVG
eukprot:12890264-Prorocentrum_lima.AAC.1